MTNRNDLGKYNLDHDQQEKFWSKVKKNGDQCWIWTGCVNSAKRMQGGYGKFRANGYHLRSHIYSWVIFNGIPPEGMVIAHVCDNRLCVNPSHLKLMSQKENVADMIKKNRAQRLFHFSQRQLGQLADQLGIDREKMFDAVDYVEGLPNIRWPNGRPRRPYERTEVF